MKNFTSKRNLIPMFILAIAGLFSIKGAFAQTVALSPSTLQHILVGASINYSATPSGFSAGGTYSYTYTAAGATVPSGTGSTRTITFPTAGTYYVTVTATKGAQTATSKADTVNVNTAPSNPTLWGCTSTSLQSFKVINGAISGGATTMFTLTFPGTTTGANSTAALGMNASGYWYWLGNTTNNSGVVEVFAANPTGTTQVKIGSLDMNAAGTSNLQFVRLGVGPDGTAWILAGDGTTLYLASFPTNGTNTVTVTLVDANVTLNGGSAATFAHGDLCVSGNNELFILANNGSTTQIFQGYPNGASTVITKQWDLLDQNGAAFSGIPDGVAFDPSGSIYLSTSSGLYFIDQATANGPAGTVNCYLVYSGGSLTDLATNYWPSGSSLPITLSNFSGSINNNITTLNWQSQNEQNFNRFEIERSSDAVNFSNIGVKTPILANGSLSTYEYTDNLTNVLGNNFYYRLKMIDNDASFRYSNTILIKKTIPNISSVSLSPNPVINRSATAMINSTVSGSVDIRIVDLSGKLVLQQKNTINIGENSISINNLDRVQTGMYIMQIINNNELSAIKFTVAH